MSGSGILYPRPRHMAESRGAGHRPAPAAPMALKAALSAPTEFLGPLKRLSKVAPSSGDFARLEASRLSPFTIVRSSEFSSQRPNRRGPKAPSQTKGEVDGR